MLIFVDESGTFTPSENIDAFSVVAAYVIPEDQLPSAHNALLNLKEVCGVSVKEELKLRRAKEPRYAIAFRLAHRQKKQRNLALRQSVYFFDS
ncbi:hypothetical protein ACDH70_12460 [Xanthomonas axonopodis pv. poinsettiicola]|uniref:hypothetical protein n=1 Tax=Xanthomonas TaxID=338 RepID=UPI001E5DDC60|nr:hypothetical protein [Xanthomonas codiaei]MCC8537819.1 hypothetical protein [Xanthomonas codiaei]